MELPKGRCVTGSVGPGRDRAEPERSGQPFLEAPERLDGVNLVDRLNPPQATRLQPVVRRVSPGGLQPVPLSHRSGISKRVMIIVNDP